ncbi:MAG: hypothetical protein V1726_03690 [Methanobacteriota archaeon]
MMQMMDIRVDKDNGSTLKKETELFGDVFGFFDGTQKLSKQETIQHIEEIKEIGELAEFLRFTIGSFYVTRKHGDDIHVLCSPACQGFYYLQKENELLLSDDQKRLYRDCELKDVDVESVIVYVYNGNIFERPFRTLFTSVKRMPPGTVTTISRGFQLTYEFYLKKPMVKTGNEYTMFTQGYDTIFEVICEQEKNLQLALSGGIDSVLLLLAFRNAKIHPVIQVSETQTRETATAELLAEYFCETAYAELKRIEKPPDKKITDELFRKMLCSSSFTLYPFMDSSVKYVLSGDYMDRAYGSYHTSSQSEFFRATHPVLNLCGYQIRNQLPYITMLLKLRYKYNPGYLSKLYLTSKKIGDMISEDTSVFFSRDTLGSWKRRYLNHLLQLNLYLVDAKNRVLSDYSKHLPITIVQPAINGLLLDWALQHTRTMKDALSYKYLTFRYMKERIGVSYDDIVKKVIHKNKTFLDGLPTQKSIKPVKRDVPLDVVKEVFFKDKVHINHKMLDDVYQKLTQDTIVPTDFGKLERIVNIQLYLEDLFQ